MHLISKLFIFCVMSAVIAHAQSSFQTNVNTAIPDDNPTGVSSTIDVEGLGPQLDDITLNLDIAGGFNGDLYAYLSHGSTGFAVLLNRVGKTTSNPFGYSDQGFHVILSDAASLDIHNYGGNGGLPLMGTWQPDGRNIDPQQVLDTTPRTATFSSFLGSDPNGLWTLVVADFAVGGGQAVLQSWAMNLTPATVPEPGAGQLFLTMAGTGLFQYLRRRRVS